MSVQLSSLSPRSYKREVATLETSVDNFKSQIQRLIDTFKQFSNTGSLRDGVFLSDTVLEFGGSQNSGSRECEVMTIGETVKFLETSRRQLLDNVQGIFVRPLEEFLHTDINDIQVMKQRVAESKEEFNQAKLRFEAARSSGKPTSKSNKELEEAKKAFKVAEITYSNKLIDIMTRKEFEVVEKLCSYMFAQANFFHEGYEALSKLEPTMRQMMNTLVNAQNDYLVGKNQFNIEDMLNKQKDDWGSPMIDLQLKQGYIFLKKKSSWIRRWLVVTDGLLYIYKGWKDLEPINTINLLLCTVKVMTSERSHCLALISPEIQMTFQAMGQEDMIEWKAVIEAGIGLQLTKKKTNTNTKNQAEMTTSEEKFAYLQELREIDTNRVCADCNQPDPEWGLMNLGVLICYECSGVHRSLGVHISKVRSLTLDAWNDELFYIIKTCGNEKGNKIYEHNIQGMNKLNPSSDRKAREEYIRAKYDDKKFVEKPQLSLPQLQLEMLESCNEGDLYSVMKLIAQGVDVNFKVNPDLKQSLLHQVTIDGKATTYVLELLIQNGAQVFSMDSTGNFSSSFSYFAAKFDRVTYARMLCLRGASENAEDKEQQTPLSISNSIPNSKVYKYFKKEITNEELAGLQPADLESLQIIKSNFVGGVDLIKGKLEELRKQLKDADSVETTLEILKKIRAIKLAICFDCDR